MRYLFFDIECCDGKHICEFGYIVTDTQFNEIEKKEIIINPDKPFNLTGRPHQKDLKLHYSEDVYNSSVIFPNFYDEIKNLIEYPDQIIVGHAISNDAKFLNIACRRYKVAPIVFRSVDSQIMFKECFNLSHVTSLETAGEMFDVKKPEYMHKADVDAILTMELVANMCKALNCTLDELINMCPQCKRENDGLNYNKHKKSNLNKSRDKNVATTNIGNEFGELLKSIKFDD